MQRPRPLTPEEGRTPLRARHIDAILRGVAPVIQEHVTKTVMPLITRIAELEARLAQLEKR
jgi:hypothetical protein